MERQARGSTTPDHRDREEKNYDQGLVTGRKCAPCSGDLYHAGPITPPCQDGDRRGTTHLEDLRQLVATGTCQRRLRSGLQENYSTRWKGMQAWITTSPTGKARNCPLPDHRKSASMDIRGKGTSLTRTEEKQTDPDPHIATAAAGGQIGHDGKGGLSTKTAGTHQWRNYVDSLLVFRFGFVFFRTLLLFFGFTCMNDTCFVTPPNTHHP